MDTKLAVGSSQERLTNVVCWTRMQAEAGQQIEAIIARKEIERRVGQGLFFWGIGNAPNRSIRDFVSKGQAIDIVFSLMKTRPKLHDCSPNGILVWQSYFDASNNEVALPPHVLVTSRFRDETLVKRPHYALMCYSEEELKIQDLGSFDPLAYRNVGDVGGAVGHSQVTALVIRTAKEKSSSVYRINLLAKLFGSYWVKLGQPRLLKSPPYEHIKRAAQETGRKLESEWIKMVATVRGSVQRRFKSIPTLFK